MNRRSFLKVSGGAALALSLPIALSSKAISQVVPTTKLVISGILPGSRVLVATSMNFDGFISEKDILANHTTENENLEYDIPYEGEDREKNLIIRVRKPGILAVESQATIGKHGAQIHIVQWRDEYY